MKKHIPNTLTLCNLFTGCIGITLAYDGKLDVVFVCILISGVFDFLDGLSARVLKVKSEIGKQLDSLADMISFGFLPSIIIYNLLIDSGTNYPLYYLSFMIACFSALRLAKFNIDENQTDQFIGLNTPANTILIGSLIFWKDHNFLNSLNWLFTPAGLLLTTVLSSLLLVSPIKFLSFKFASLGFKENSSRYFLIASAVILFMLFQELSFPFIILSYIVFSLPLNINRA